MRGIYNAKKYQFKRENNDGKDVKNDIYNLLYCFDICDNDGDDCADR